MEPTRLLPKVYLLLSLFLLGACTAKNMTLATDDDVLVETYWMLISLEGEDLQGPIDTKTAYIRFREDGNEVNGFTGCNKFFGKYEMNGDSIRLSDLGSTKMACPAMEQENKLMGILARVDSYSISDYLLTLYGGGKAIATFRAGNEMDLVGNEQ